MRTRQIPPEQWQSFFNQFTLLYQGSHIHVEAMRGGGADLRSHICDLPLACVAFVNPRSNGLDGWVEIIAGDRPDNHVTHCVAKAASICLAEEDDGEAVALQMESTDDVVTMVRFEPPRENLPEGFLVSQSQKESSCKYATS